MNARFSVNVTTTWQWDLGQCVDAYARLGIPAIGVTRLGLDEYGRGKGIKKIKDSGLKVSSIAGIGPYTVTEPQAFQQNVESGIAFMDVAAELGADCVYVMAGPRGSLTWEDAAERLTEGLTRLTPAARERGIRLAVEPIHPMRQDLTFVNTARDTVSIIEPLDSQHVGYVFDFWHLWWERGVLETIARSVDRIFSVQVSDHKAITMRTMDRAMLGEGIIPLRELLKALEHAGYKGYYDMEIISDDMAAMGYETALQRIVPAFHDLFESIDA